jgi:small subunit ribosomal protein S16
MVVIRLARGGSKKSPFYNIVVTDRRNPRDGRFIERVGFFNPSARGQAARLEMNKERVLHWIGQGAQPSERVYKLIEEIDARAAGKIVAAAPSKAEQRRAQAEQSRAHAKAKAAEAPAEEAAAE